MDDVPSPVVVAPNTSLRKKDFPNITNLIARPGQTVKFLETEGHLAAEDDEGWVEYKWRLTGITAQRFEHLVTQMRFRVAEGHGQCVYEIGVADKGQPRGLPPDEYEESIQTVQRMANKLHFDVKVLYQRTVQETPTLLRCAELLVTQTLSELNDLRIAFCGTTGSGKSTLVGVLTNGALDDGNGSVRQGVFNHKHEVDSGRTSSVSHRLLGFDETGRITNYDDDKQQNNGDPVQYASLTQAQNSTRTIAERSVKLVTMMDLGGDSKYSKTAIFGMTSRSPGFACICVSPEHPVTDVQQYVQLCSAMRIPYFIVVLKVDTINEIEADDFILELDNAVSAALGGHESVTTFVTSGDGANDAQHFVDTTNVVPVFPLSCVTGVGIDALKSFLHRLPVQPLPVNEPAEVLIDASFTVTGVGLVLSGFVSKGFIAVGDPLQVGPDRSGGFHSVSVQSIHLKGSHVTHVGAGSDATFAVGAVPSSVLFSRKGTVLVSPQSVPNVCREFEVRVKVLTEDCMTVNQEPIVHCRNIRQAARIVWVSPEPLSRGQTGLMRVRFLYHPEVIDEQSVVVMRWNRHAKLIGHVCRVEQLSPACSPSIPPQPSPTITADSRGADAPEAVSSDAATDPFCGSSTKGDESMTPSASQEDHGSLT